MGSRSLLLLAALGLAFVVALTLWAARPEFLYHTGAVAVAPDEVLSLRFYFRSALPVSKIVVTELIGDGCDSIQVLESAWHNGVPGGLGFVDLTIKVSHSNDRLVTGLLVERSGKHEVIPVGQVRILTVCGVNPELRLAGLTRSTHIAGGPTEVTVSMSSLPSVEIGGLAPDLGLATQVAIRQGGAGSSHHDVISLTLSESLWLSSACLIYRPVLWVAASEHEEYGIGPLIEVIMQGR